jgi:hypothetical protein
MNQSINQSINYFLFRNIKRCLRSLLRRRNSRSFRSVFIEAMPSIFIEFIRSIESYILLSAFVILVLLSPPMTANVLPILLAVREGAIIVLFVFVVLT